MKKILKAKRQLTGTAPKRKVATREETLDARAKEAKSEGPKADDSNVSRSPRSART
jgi:hypothetical protein|tara:strand:- start:13 stop:180 length:168 start_codon:yes stop_codon:yes gene_type:complete